MDLQIYLSHPVTAFTGVPQLHLCKFAVLLHVVRADAKDLRTNILELAVGIPEGACLLCAAWCGSLCSCSAQRC